MKSLLLTLGHNSSAVLVEEGNIICGYEEERLTRKKSDSSFPYKAINLCLKELDNDLESIYVSHWFENCKLSQNKWCDLEFITDLAEFYECPIKEMNHKDTHHSAHAWSSIAFLSQYKKPLGSYDIIVCDGFGNKKEVFTHFKFVDGFLEVKKKIKGYENSLGLLYQYATDYCGMKMNQDEYKFLGYEAKADELKFNMNEVIALSNHFINRRKTAEYSFNQLNQCKKEVFFSLFDDVMRSLKSKPTIKNKRILIGFFIQRTVEEYFVEYIKKNKIKSILLSGGVFYNVKLNHRILNEVSSLCVMPIAGDSGAAFGMYFKDHHKMYFKNFCFGKREGFIDKIDEKTEKDIIKRLKNNEIINILKGGMEFGPRALCNTSTLALPSQHNVNKINEANNRNTIMPMAPVMTEDKVKELFFWGEIGKVVGSYYYMIITFLYSIQDISKIKGVSHNIPFSFFFSGRPQVIKKDNAIYNIVSKCGGILINTSYNIHGNPIVFDDVSKDNNGFRTYLIKKEVEVING